MICRTASSVTYTPGSNRDRSRALSCPASCTSCAATAQRAISAALLMRRCSRSDSHSRGSRCVARRLLCAACAALWLRARRVALHTCAASRDRGEPPPRRAVLPRRRGSRPRGGGCAHVAPVCSAAPVHPSRPRGVLGRALRVLVWFAASRRRGLPLVAELALWVTRRRIGCCVCVCCVAPRRASHGLLSRQAGDGKAHRGV